MPSDRDIERLVHQVLETVLARLGETPAGRTRRAVVLLPTATARLEALARVIEGLRSGGFAARVIASAQVASELERRGLAGRFGPEVFDVAGISLGAELADLTGSDHVVVGSLGFTWARGLVELNDEDPFVRVVAQARLAGMPVFAIADDLTAAAGAMDDRVGAEARRVLRDIQAMGITLGRLDELAAAVLRRAAERSTVAQSLGGLLTEADVERLAAGGERTLALGARTVVTPLARSRAQELGVTIVKGER